VFGDLTGLVDHPLASGSVTVFHSPPSARVLRGKGRDAEPHPFDYSCLLLGGDAQGVGELGGIARRIGGRRGHPRLTGRSPSLLVSSPLLLLVGTSRPLLSAIATITAGVGAGIGPKDRCRIRPAAEQ
jgi:hypothetical protein